MAANKTPLCKAGAFFVPPGRVHFDCCRRRLRFKHLAVYTRFGVFVLIFPHRTAVRLLGVSPSGIAPG